jgi:hypothetical protein
MGHGSRTPGRKFDAPPAEQHPKQTKAREGVVGAAPRLSELGAGDDLESVLAWGGDDRLEPRSRLRLRLRGPLEHLLSRTDVSDEGVAHRLELTEREQSGL